MNTSSDIKLKLIKSQIRFLYENNPNVHISIATNYSRVHSKKIKAVITGIYPNIFTAEEDKSGRREHYNFQYVDVLTGAIELPEIKIEEN